MNSLVQRQMIIWTFGLVLFFGAAVTFSLLEPPTTIAKKMAPKHSRLPASVSPADTSELVVDSSAQVSDLDVTCESSLNAKIAVSVQQVRLRGTGCLTNEKSRKPSSVSKKFVEIKKIEIHNLTNGFVATVFTPTTNRFSTDYIGLKPGENRIEIQTIYTNGTRESRQVLLTR